MTPSAQFLRAQFSNGGRVVIQTHDYPDFDAVAAAFAFGELLEDFRPFLVAAGDLDSYSLQETLRQLAIPLISAAEWQGLETDRILLVDSNLEGGNVTRLPGEVRAVIDHHPVSREESGCYTDIRPDLGSCSTLAYDYLRQVEKKPSGKVATALMMGLMMDTGFLTRGVSAADLEAFSSLYFLGDWRLGSYLLKNSLSVEAVPRFQEALSHLRVDRGFGFTWLDQQAPAETVALIADDFMRFHEIHFVAVAAPAGTDWKLSARSDDPLIPAGGVIKRALGDLGQGGGHIHMGGGLLPLDNFPGTQEMFQRFRDAIDYYIRKVSE